jgi:DNA repair protein RecO (recombination protein O)
MTHIGIVYYEKPTRDLQLLSQTHLIDPHLGMIGDMERSTLGMAAAELIDRAVIGKEGTREIFYLFVSTLAALNKQTGFLEAILWYFQSHFIDLMGYKPTWDACLVCRSSLGREGGYFQPESGGLLCGKCGSHHGGLVVQGETLEVLYWLQGDNLDEAARLNPEASQKAEIRKMFDLYFRTHIENLRKIRSLELYYQLAS